MRFLDIHNMTVLFSAVFFFIFLLSRCVNSLARLANTLSLLTYGSLFQLHSNVKEECLRYCVAGKFKKCLLSPDNSSPNKQWIYRTQFQTQQMEGILPTLYSAAEAMMKMPWSNQWYWTSTVWLKLSQFSKDLSFFHYNLKQIWNEIT